MESTQVNSLTRILAQTLNRLKELQREIRSISHKMVMLADEIAKLRNMAIIDSMSINTLTEEYYKCLEAIALRKNELIRLLSLAEKYGTLLFKLQNPPSNLTYSRKKLFELRNQENVVFAINSEIIKRFPELVRVSCTIVINCTKYFFLCCRRHLGRIINVITNY